MPKSKYRALARIIALADGGCYVVFPAWNSELGVFVPTLPLRYAGQALPWRWYVTVNLNADSYQDLHPEWVVDGEDTRGMV